MEVAIYFLHFFITYLLYGITWIWFWVPFSSFDYHIIELLRVISFRYEEL